MKIALLNLPIDLNYGGNIQRFALSKVLSEMGHEVEHIQLIERKSYLLSNPKKYFVYLKRFLYSIIGMKTLPVFYERRCEEGLLSFMEFYNTHVLHTRKKFLCYNDLQAYNWDSYDAFVVGSDQVWRPDMTKRFGLKTYFLSFVSRKDAKKIAYAVSFGKDTIKLPDNDISYFQALYNDFTAVSVREKEAITILHQYKMNSPSPILVLDPTLLLSADDYRQLLKKDGVMSTVGRPYLLTYFINKTLLDEDMVNNIARNMRLDIINIDIDSAYKVSILQWIDYFMNAAYVITDSYHGLVFSIIFNKAFKIVYNMNGGISRIRSLFDTFEISNNENIDWTKVNENINKYKETSLNFLKKSLEQ